MPQSDKAEDVFHVLAGEQQCRWCHKWMKPGRPMKRRWGTNNSHLTRGFCSSKCSRSNYRMRPPVLKGDDDYYGWRYRGEGNCGNRQ